MVPKNKQRKERTGKIDDFSNRGTSKVTSIKETLPDMGFDKDKFVNMCNYIEKMRKFGKQPLFIIGAGVSAGKIPTMTKIFKILKTILEKKLKEKNKNREELLKHTKDLAEILLSQEVDESVCAYFFDLLQNNEKLKDIWTEFTKRFLEESKNATPTEFHKFVAEQIVKFEPPAICISLNYDGLTARAIKEIAENGESKNDWRLWPARILSLPDEIEEFFSMDAKEIKNNLAYPVIKLKGDVFYAICLFKQCPNGGRRIPIYERPIHEFEEFKCPECGSELRLELDFPGQQIKEDESKKVIKKIVQYFLPSLSCVVVCGVSGRWDRELVEFLRFCVDECNLKVYYCNRSIHLKKKLGNIKNFEYIFVDFIKWKRKCLEGDLKYTKKEEKKEDITKLGKNEIITKNDFFWVKDKEIDRIKIKKRQNDKKIEIKITRKPKFKFDNLEKLEAYKSSQSIYQLGPKTRVLSPENRDAYTRLSHSLGVRVVGVSWWKALEDEIRRTIFKNCNLNVWEECLELALLLHDISHLPFSHLAEEVLSELNFSILGEKYRHDEWTLYILRDQDKKKLKEIIGNKFGSENADEYYEFIQNIIAGISGIPFLDGIANSSIDADKIDYIFRDSEFTGRGVRLKNKKEWLQEFLSDVTLTMEGLIRLGPKAAECAFDLLKERMYLYENVYLHPASRVIERLSATVAKLWLQHKVLREVPLESFKNIKSTSRIYGFKARDLILDKFMEVEEGDEIDMVIEMCEEIDGFKVSKEVKDYIGNIKNILSNPEKSELEKYITETFFIVAPDVITLKKFVNKARMIAEDIHLTYPCTALIDIVEFPSFLPISKRRKYKYKNGIVVSEVYLVPSRDPENWGKERESGSYLLQPDYFKKYENNKARVTIIDVSSKTGEKGRYISKLFKDMCSRSGIKISK